MAPVWDILDLLVIFLLFFVFFPAFFLSQRFSGIVLFRFCLYLCSGFSSLFLFIFLLPFIQRVAAFVYFNSIFALPCFLIPSFCFLHFLLSQRLSGIVLFLVVSINVLGCLFLSSYFLFLSVCCG